MRQQMSPRPVQQSLASLILKWYIMLSSTGITKDLLGWHPTADHSQPRQPRPQLLGPTAGAGTTTTWSPRQDKTSSLRLPPSFSMPTSWFSSQLWAAGVFPAPTWRHIPLYSHRQPFSKHTFFLMFPESSKCCHFLLQVSGFLPNMCLSTVQLKPNASCVFRNFLLWIHLQYQQSKIIL